jgi:hypothetical protein
MPFSPVLLLALCLTSSASGEDVSRITERVLAVVDERPMLLSEVRAVEAVRGLARSEALEASIDERLMHQEALRLPQAAVSREEAEEALGALLETRPELALWSRAELLRLLRRQAVILRYVEFRFRPQIRITEEALRAAWNEELGGKPDGPPFEEAVPALRARLERRALDERIEDWVKRLRERAEVRYVEGPGSPPPPEGP